jgi:hypothetical protein
MSKKGKSIQNFRPCAKKISASSLRSSDSSTFRRKARIAAGLLWNNYGSDELPSSFSSLKEGGFPCQEPVMCLKTETLVDVNGSAVVFKDIQDNKREVLFE